MNDEVLLNNLALMVEAGLVEEADVVEQLANIDSGQALQLSERYQRLAQQRVDAAQRNQNADQMLQGLSRFGRAALSTINSIPGAGSLVGDAVNTVQALSPSLDDIGSALATRGQQVQDFLDPLAVAQRQIADESSRVAQEQAFQNSGTAADLEPLLGISPTAGPSPLDLAVAESQNAALNQVAGVDPNQQLVDFMATERQTNADFARSQAEAQINRANLQRLGTQLQLQQAPQVANTLGAAGITSQQGAIGAQPNNIANSLALLQRLAPTTQVGDIRPAVRANISQRNQSARLQDQANAQQAAQMRRALELARQQFQVNTARPLLSAPRT